MVHVRAVIPVCVSRIVDQIVLNERVCRIDRNDAVSGNVMYVVVLDHNVAAADPLAVSGILITGVAACSAYQRTACPYTLHIDRFMAYLVNFISVNCQSVVPGLYLAGMV